MFCAVITRIGFSAAYGIRRNGAFGVTRLLGADARQILAQPGGFLW
jgi:hypothetical protein